MDGSTSCLYAFSEMENGGVPCKKSQKMICSTAMGGIHDNLLPKSTPK